MLLSLTLSLSGSGGVYLALSHTAITDTAFVPTHFGAHSWLLCTLSLSVRLFISHTHHSLNSKGWYFFTLSLGSPFNSVLQILAIVFWTVFLLELGEWYRWRHEGRGFSQAQFQHYSCGSVSVGLLWVCNTYLFIPLLSLGYFTLSTMFSIFVSSLYCLFWSNVADLGFFKKNFCIACLEMGFPEFHYWCRLMVFRLVEVLEAHLKFLEYHALAIKISLYSCIIDMRVNFVWPACCVFCSLNFFFWMHRMVCHYWGEC